MVLAVLLIILALLSMPFAIMLVRSALAGGTIVPRLEALTLGAVTNFFDTLGIGSLAPTMAWIKFRALVPDRLIPATMLTGYALPTAAQSAIFLVLLGVNIDPILLLCCILAFAAGSALGVPLVAKLPLRYVQMIVGLALLVAAALYAMANLDLMPLGGSATTLAPPWFFVAIAAHLAMGILLNFGIGNYAPTLIMLSLMGMDPRLAFPIMATAGAVGILTVGVRYVGTPQLDIRIVLGLVLGGIPAVLVAAFLVKEMPIEMLRWLIVAVVTYAATLMLRSSLRPDEAAAYRRGDSD